MKAVLLDVPESVLQDRRRRGLDKRDELWDGVLHMVPPASELHQRVGAELLMVLGAQARRRGLRAYYETGLFRTGDDYRVPDQAYVRPEATSERGLEEGADVVVEFVSEGDETYDKIDWYAARGVAEMLIVHPSDRRVELLRRVGDRLLPVTADAEGVVRSDVLGAAFATVDGPRLRVTGDETAVDV